MPRPEHYDTKYRDRLSPRQEEILRLIAKGRTNGEISTDLDISLDGVKWHVREILSKVDVEKREQAVERWKADRRRPSRVLNALVGSTAFKWVAGGVGALAVGGAALAGIALLASDDDDDEEPDREVVGEFVNEDGPLVRVAFGGGTFAAGVTVVELPSGESYSSLPTPPLNGEIGEQQLVWSPDGERLIVEEIDLSGEEPVLRHRLYDAQLNEVANFPHGLRLGFFQPAWTADARRLALVGEEFLIVDRDGAVVASVPLPEQFVIDDIVGAPANSAGYIAWSPDGETVALAAQDSVLMLGMNGSVETGTFEIDDLARLEWVDWDAEGVALYYQRATQDFTERFGLVYFDAGCDCAVTPNLATDEIIERRTAAVYRPTGGAPPDGWPTADLEARVSALAPPEADGTGGVSPFAGGGGALRYFNRPFEEPELDGNGNPIQVDQFLGVGVVYDTIAELVVPPKEHRLFTPEIAVVGIPGPETPSLTDVEDEIAGETRVRVAITNRRAEPEDQQIRVVEFPGGRDLFIDNQWDWYQDPRWSPDGSHLAVTQQRFDGEGEASVVVYEINGGSPVEIAFDTAELHAQPAWAPDSSLLALGYDGFELVTPDGEVVASASVEASDESVEGGVIMWAPDSSFAVLTGPGELIVLGRDGSTERIGYTLEADPERRTPTLLGTFVEDGELVLYAHYPHRTLRVGPGDEYVPDVRAYVVDGGTGTIEQTEPPADPLEFMRLLEPDVDELPGGQPDELSERVREATPPGLVTSFLEPFADGAGAVAMVGEQAFPPFGESAVVVVYEDLGGSVALRREPNAMDSLDVAAVVVEPSVVTAPGEDDVVAEEAARVRVAVGDLRDDALRLFELPGGAEEVMDTQLGYLRPEWSPDGSHVTASVIIDADDDEVAYVIYSPETGAEALRPLTLQSNVVVPAWAPDSSLLALVADEFELVTPEGDVVASTARPASFLDDFFGDDGEAEIGTKMTWAPDSSFAVLTAPGEIIVLRTDGSSTRVEFEPEPEEDMGVVLLGTRVEESGALVLSTHYQPLALEEEAEYIPEVRWFGVNVDEGTLSRIADPEDPWVASREFAPLASPLDWDHDRLAEQIAAVTPAGLTDLRGMRPIDGGRGALALVAENTARPHGEVAVVVLYEELVEVIRLGDYDGGAPGIGEISVAVVRDR